MDTIVYYREYDKGGDHTEQLKKALLRCRITKAEVLHFDPGVYHFYGTYAGEYECNISNHSPNGKKKIIFPLIGYKNFKIEAEGCLFVIHDFSIPFLVAESENICVIGPTIEAVDLQSAQGTVVSADGNSYTVEMDSSDPWDIRRGVLVFRACGLYTECDNFIRFDRNGNRVRGAGDHGYYKILAEKSGENCIRFINNSEIPEVGERIAYYGGERRCCAFFLRGSSDISIENVTVTRHTGMGVIAQMCENISLDFFRVIPKPGNVITTEADATHFVNCSGVISLRNCVFENMMDDAMNVHGIYTQILRSSPGEIYVRYMHNEAKGIDIYRKGDVIAISDKETVLPMCYANIRDVEVLNNDTTRLLLEEYTQLEAGLVVENITRQPKVYMGGCTVRNNRARGILLGTKGKIIIAENYFRTEDQAILFECDPKYWFESGSVSDVYIDGNIFDDCAAGRGRAVIEAVPREKTENGRYFHGEIRILENKLISCTAPLAYINNAEKVDILGNSVEGNGTVNIITEHTGKTMIQEDAELNIVEA